MTALTHTCVMLRRSPLCASAFEGGGHVKHHATRHAIGASEGGAHGAHAIPTSGATESEVAPVSHANESHVLDEALSQERSAASTTTDAIGSTGGSAGSAGSAVKTRSVSVSRVVLAPSCGLLQKLHDEGRKVIEQEGLPRSQMEDFRYNKLLPFKDVTRVIASMANTTMAIKSNLPLLLMGGRALNMIGDLPQGVTLHMFMDESPPKLITQVSEVLGQMIPPRLHGVSSLGACGVAMVVVLRVDPNADVTMQIHHTGVTDPMLHLQTPSATGSEGALLQLSSVRVVLLIGAQARMRLYQFFPPMAEEMPKGLTSLPMLLRTQVLEANLAEGSRLSLIGIQDEASHVMHHEMVGVRVGRAASFEQFYVQSGAHSSRKETHIRLEGSGASTALHGISLASKGKVMDSHHVCQHIAENTQSRQVQRTLVEDGGVGIYRGKIHVHKGAQKTDGYQHSKGLMLGDNAEIYHKPELEIYADDVKCSHGSAVSSFKDEAAFYLRSRGLSRTTAARLLAEAEAMTALEVDSQPASVLQALRDHVHDRIHRMAIRV